MSLLTKTVPIANDARSTFGRPSDYSAKYVTASATFARKDAL